MKVTKKNTTLNRLVVALRPNLSKICFSTGKQMCFSTGKQCSLWKHLYILLGSSGHSDQRKPGDGHQYILLSRVGNSVILSKGSQAIVISVFCCPVWEVTVILSKGSQAIVISIFCCPVWELSSEESQVTAIGTCSVWDVAVILSQKSQAIDIGICGCSI